MLLGYNIIIIFFPTSLLTKIPSCSVAPSLLCGYRCCICEQMLTRTCYFMYASQVVMHAVPNVIMLFHLFHRLTCTKLCGLGHQLSRFPIYLLLMPPQCWLHLPPPQLLHLLPCHGQCRVLLRGLLELTPHLPLSWRHRCQGFRSSKLVEVSEYPLALGCLQSPASCLRKCITENTLTWQN